MKRTLFLITAVFLMALDAQAMDRDYLRRNYGNATTDKQLCESLIAALQNGRQDNVGLAYLGGLQTIWASHVFNPLSKWRTFSEGRDKVEKAFQNDPSNLEIRIIRLSIQKNAPRFLGYYEQIDEDEKFVRTHRQSAGSGLLADMAGSLLTQKER